MKPIALLTSLGLACSATYASAQILPADRTTIWHPGVPGGVPNRTTVCAVVNASTYGNGASDASSGIQAVVSACPVGQVVQLSAGTFTVNNYILINKGITLRGAGPTATVLQKTNGAIAGIDHGATDIQYDLTWNEVGINASHMVGSHHVLFEGNESFNYDSDNTHGNAIYMTVFRNHLSGFRRDYPGTSNARTAGLNYGSWWHSFVGNVLGVSGAMTGWGYENSFPWNSRYIWELGYQAGQWDQAADPKVLSTVIRGGNFDYVTNTVHWESIAPQTIPNSLYLSAKPAFFGTYAWPWVDPTGLVKLSTLPAKARFDAGTPFAPPPSGPPTVPTGLRIVGG